MCARQFFVSAAHRCTKSVAILEIRPCHGERDLRLRDVAVNIFQTSRKFRLQVSQANRVGDEKLQRVMSDRLATNIPSSLSPIC